MDNKIELKNLSSLSGLNFYIPDYQRGYRWTQTQVIKLLDDLKLFYTRCHNSQAEFGEFYCLQPVVVKCIGKDEYDKPIYEVIDGQQRLTTLFLLYKSLTWNKIQEEYPDAKSYHITYQSRPDSKGFLEDIENKNQDDASSFIDYYHMKIVYDAIIKWIQTNGKLGKMIDLLFDETIENNKDIAHNVRVIWYEIGEQERAASVDIFTRLNIGKIPLTNAELIKALLLRKGNFESNSNAKDMLLTQFHIAEEWNQIEQRLQDDAFWYFIYNSSNPITYETRIEYIFDLMTSKYNFNKDEDEDFYYTFVEFNKRITDNGNNAVAVEKEWNNVKNNFGIIESWYSDHTLFHLIGYLIETGISIPKLLRKSERMTKSFFLSFVKRLIRFRLRDVDLDTILYKDAKTKNVLLLFNVLTVLESNRSDQRFSFDKYKKESWDKEHIASQHNKEFPNDANKRIVWLNDMIFYFVGAKGDDNQLIVEIQNELSRLKNKANLSAEEKNELDIIDMLLTVKQTSITDPVGNAKKTYDTDFNALYQKVSNHFKETNIPDKDKHNISNLALLNYSINRSYGDAFFPVKRSIIKENDMTGVFVPIATKNVFMKYYSKKIDNMMYWTQDDASSYLSAMKKMLEDYLN